MPYYQGDYYGANGYYQGDPGIFGFLGGLAKKAIGFIPGVGPALSAAAGAIVKRAPGPIVRAGQVAAGVAVRHPVLTAAGAAGAVGALGRMTAPGRGVLAGARPGRYGQPGEKGYHQSKKHPGVWVRNRRMNVCNPRALRRSLRRAHGFAKLAMHTIHLIHPKKKARFGGFRKRRAKR